MSADQYMHVATVLLGWLLVGHYYLCSAVSSVLDGRYIGLLIHGANPTLHIALFHTTRNNLIVQLLIQHRSKVLIQIGPTRQCLPHEQQLIPNYCPD